MSRKILEALFSNRVGVLATMHQKQRVMAPILERELNIKVLVPDNFDTDKFGTFTREIERTGNQLEAARLKAEAAIALTGETIAFASEGTFGPHPFLPGLSLNRELVIFLDQKHDIEIIGQQFSLETNFNHKTVKNIEEAYQFSQEVGFPDHGLVVRVQTSEDGSKIIKGITTDDQLFEAVNLALNQSQDGNAHIETDMRAHYNPTRMKNIEKATWNLIQTIHQLCPNCSWPGFEIIEKKKGLPCSLCNLPTESTLSVIYQCKKCGFSKENFFPQGMETADPTQCAYCNP
jgi:DNA-directed RNA polymerase subunit RPC12/RpoP